MRGADEVAQTRLRAELESCEAKAAAERDAALRRAVAESKRRGYDSQSVHEERLLQ